MRNSKNIEKTNFYSRKLTREDTNARNFVCLSVCLSSKEQLIEGREIPYVII
jgi:hypothetical protein